MSLSPQGNAANLRSTDRARAIFATLYYLLLKLIDFHLISDSLQCKSVMQISREEWSLQRLTSCLPLQSQHFYFLPLSSLSASPPTFQVLLSHFIVSPSVQCLVLALLLRPHGGLSRPSANPLALSHSLPLIQSSSSVSQACIQSAADTGEVW